jgi:hypothetical protein
MAYQLQMLRQLIETYPDRTGGLDRHVRALEASIENTPELCLGIVRGLFEAVQHTIAELGGFTFPRNTGFPDRMQFVIQNLDFSIDGHPNAADINMHLTALLDSINAASVALARLSNIPNMRHGGSLSWSTLARRHADMLGGFCDALVSFLLECAWGRMTAAALAEIPPFEAEPMFNDWLDEEHDPVVVLEAIFQPSLVLFTLDREQYDSALVDWRATEA